MHSEGAALYGDDGEPLGWEVEGEEGDVGYFVPHQVIQNLFTDQMSGGDDALEGEEMYEDEDVILGSDFDGYVTGEDYDIMGAATLRPDRRRALSRYRRRPQYSRRISYMVPKAGACTVSTGSPNCPPKGRYLVLPFDSVVDIAAGSQATITQRPQILFQPSRVVIPSSITAFFLVNDLKIGKNSQFTASGALPSAVFAENAVGVGLAMDAAQIAQDIVLVVTNISADPHRFNAAMIGESCE